MSQLNSLLDSKMRGAKVILLALTLGQLFTRSTSQQAAMKTDKLACQPKVLKFNQGRYTCNRLGEVICSNGWTDVDNLCKTPLCTGGCGENGVCKWPEVCACAVGWGGDGCDVCIPLPGCLHGRCEKPFQCLDCDQGWTGPLCNQPSCEADGCKHGQCLAPDVCSCFPGWTGPGCDECIKSPSCLNGNCKDPSNPLIQEPNGCICDQGWAGPNCDCPICKEGCDLDHGYCSEPGECDCNLGWKGPDCNECVTHPFCPEEATCTNPWGCVCTEDIDDSRYCTIGDNTLGGAEPNAPRMRPSCVILNRSPVQAALDNGSNLLPSFIPNKVSATTPSKLTSTRSQMTRAPPQTTQSPTTTTPSPKTTSPLPKTTSTPRAAPFSDRDTLDVNSLLDKFVRDDFGSSFDFGPASQTLDDIADFDLSALPTLNLGGNSKQQGSGTSSSRETGEHRQSSNFDLGIPVRGVNLKSDALDKSDVNALKPTLGGLNDYAQINFIPNEFFATQISREQARRKKRMLRKKKLNLRKP